MESHAVGHRGKRLRSPSYPGLTKARMDLEKSPCSHGWAKSKAVKGALLQPPQNTPSQAWPGHRSHPDEHGGRLCAPAKQQHLHWGPVSGSAGGITSYASLPRHTRNQRTKIFKEIKCSPRGKCPYLPCGCASELKLFNMISACMWSCKHRCPKKWREAQGHATAGPKARNKHPSPPLFFHKKIRARHFKIWDFIWWSILNSSLSSR